MKLSYILLICLLGLCLTSCGEVDENSNDANEQVNDVIITTETPEPLVLFEQDDIKVTLSEINKTIFSVELKLIIENNSARDIHVFAEKYTINDYMTSGSEGGDILTNKKLSLPINLGKYVLENLSLKTSDSFDFDFHLTFTDKSDKTWKIESDEINIHIE